MISDPDSLSLSRSLSLTHSLLNVHVHLSHLITIETILPLLLVVFCCLLLFVVVSCVVCVFVCLLVLALKEGESGLVHHPEFLKQGLLYVQDVAKKGEEEERRHRCRQIGRASCRERV